MASFYSDALLFKQPLATHSTTISWPSRPKIRLRRRGRRLPTAQLGGKKPRRGFFLARLFRRIRVRWQKLHYSCMLKKLKQYYRSLIKDLIEANASVEAYQQRALMETSFAVPVVGVSLSSYHGGGLVGNHRSILM
ncbi:Transposable element Tc1 transposase [Bienertia sinuspersici]